MNDGNARSGWLGALLVVFIVALAAVFWTVTREREPAWEGSEGHPLGKSFEYDAAAYGKTDPKLLLCDEVAPIKIGIENPHALAVGADDRLYVTAGYSLLVFSREGKRISSADLNGPGLCLAVDAGGDVFVGKRDHVEVCDAGGVRKAEWRSLGKRACLTGLAVKSDAVYAADAGNRVVHRLDRNGAVLGRIGEKNEARNEPGFVVPSPYFDLAIGPDGTLWIVDPGRHEFRNYRADGEAISSWKKDSTLDPEGFSGCCNPTHIAMRPDGSFVTSEKGLPRVKIYGPSGALAGVVAGPESFDKDVRGLDVAVDSQGRILVLDPAAGKVRVFVEREKSASPAERGAGASGARE